MKFFVGVVLTIVLCTIAFVAFGQSTVDTSMYPHYGNNIQPQQVYSVPASNPLAYWRPMPTQVVPAPIYSAPIQQYQNPQPYQRACSIRGHAVICN